MILGSIFRYELRSLLRTPARVMALIAFCLCAGYALHSGGQQVARWEATLADAAKAQAEQQEQVLQWYAQGRKGPEDRPWIDVTTPLWADRHTGSHMGRAPHALAPLSLGLSDARAETVRVDVRTNPFAGGMVELANPEKLLAGNLDLAFVLAFLAPLLLLVLVFDVGGFERDQGMLALVRVQRGRIAGWLLARLGFHTALVGAVALAAILLGGALCGALVEAPLALAAFAALALLYIAAFGALFTAVVALGRGSAFNALALSVVWIALCLLGPAAAQTRMQLAHPPGYATELTSLLREETYALYERELPEQLEELYEARPDLREAPYALSGRRDRARDRFAVTHANLALIARRGAQEAAREEAEERTAGALRWLLPPFALQHGQNLLAGNEAAAYRELRAEVLASVERRLDFLLEQAWHERSFDAESFAHLAALSPAPRAYGGTPGISHFGPLLAWILIPALLAAALLRTRLGERAARGRAPLERPTVTAAPDGALRGS